jgi:hypothetical protein
METDPKPDELPKADELPDWAQKEIDKLRKENAANRVKAKEAEDRAAKAAMTEEERRKAEAQENDKKLTAAEQRAHNFALQLSVERQARKMGIVDEEAAFRLLDASKVEFDDAGNPTNVEALLGELVKARTWLLGGGEAKPTGGNPSAPPKKRGGELTQKDLADMTPQQIAEMDTAEVQKAMTRT